MMQIIRRYLIRFYQYHYKGYLRHYYKAATHPKPIRFIILVILLVAFILTIAILGTISIIHNEYQGNLYYVSGLAFFMYLIVFAAIPTIVLLIQGYRHRDKISAEDIPKDLPKNTGNEIWWIIFLVGTISAIRRYFGW